MVFNVVDFQIRNEAVPQLSWWGSGLRLFPQWERQGGPGRL